MFNIFPTDILRGYNHPIVRVFGRLQRDPFALLEDSFR